MPISVPNPYTGDDDQTCSVSFQAQQKMAAGVGSAQTEAEYNKSKLLGEIGVMKGKLANGQIPDGTKVFAYQGEGFRGYYFVKNGALKERSYDDSGNVTSKEAYASFSSAEFIVKGGKYKASIPQSVSPKPKPEQVPFTNKDAQEIGDDPDSHDGKPIAVNAAGDYITYDSLEDKFFIFEKQEYGFAQAGGSYSLQSLIKGQPWYKSDGKAATPKSEPAFQPVSAGAPPPTFVAAPTPATPVDASSTSVGSMSHEDVAAMFVKIKDDLAKEKGLNIKGANPALDEEVFKAIGDATGYTPAEVKGKIDAYKAAGNKLSALKKKVLAGTKQVPTGKAPQKPVAAPKPLVPTPAAPKPDPKPHGVPTVATPAVANAAKAAVKQEAAKDPAKVYTDEDVAAAYIIAKDTIVANNTKGWTLYTKNPEMDLEIAIQVGLKTGLNPTQQKVAIANYLASGKKLSQLKKALAKQGAFTPKADTLKKSGTDKSLADKAKDVDAKADAGYTPTPTPTTAGPNKAPTDTGKPMPKAAGERAREAGDISGVSAPAKSLVYSTFKGQGSLAYLSSSNEQTYEALVKTQASMKSAANQDLSLLQILRIIDEEGAKKFKAENGKLFEKKTATWLTTPEGTTYIKKKEKELAEQAEKAAKQAKLKAEAEAAAKKLMANQPPLPADSAQYEGWSLDKAKRVSQTWLDAKPWDAKQKRDLVHYTGSAYTEMNGYLRGLSSGISDRSKTAIEGAKAGMRPTTEPILVRRGTGLNQFQSIGVGRGDATAVWGITGKTFKDEGFLSTSAGGTAAFGGEARLEIECPVGTPMAYVAPISKFPGENEMLLQAGMEYKVLNVRKEGNTFVVRVRVVNWPGKVN